ncbi:tRNA pseudouridine(55) synthase TruB [Candidatus Endobugula sertula]|uniref:tRNA pseudouridine synthase B n=1 Tax=Candidatus Endobugula sertula TaxID=62101 RepID=A0A1D2QMK7_9GAMM|nr:tRNA pseudouridine(55) synthase TruB [Candidatus Endobugula sertula]
MGRRTKWGRAIDGVLLLNKDTGMTSNDALQQVKRLFFAKRAGHTGSLDPLATGVLPICLGEASKFSQYLLDADKRYSSTFCLGLTTETGDCDGTVIATCDAEHITQSRIETALTAFRGEIKQIPSMYSALKYQGKPLYKWAREGINVPRKARPVIVYNYQMTNFRGNGSHPEIDVEVHCSKGTYIRSLAEDLGKQLGVGAHVSRLHRRMVGSFDEVGSITLQQLSDIRGDGKPEQLDRHLLPVDAPVQALNKVIISDEMGYYFCQGQGVMSIEAYRFAAEGDKVRVCLEHGEFIGVAELKEGQLAPKRVVKRPVSQ